MEQACAPRHAAAACNPLLWLAPLAMQEHRIELPVPPALDSPLSDLDDGPPVEWTEQDVVKLHCGLLEKVAGLASPATALEEKVEILRWVFTDPERDRRPFSFVSCVEVASLSKCSPLQYMGKVDAQSIRDWIARHIDVWFTAAMQIYPDWVRDEIVAHPDWVARQLEKNPQWLNEQIRDYRRQGDLFA